LQTIYYTSRPFSNLLLYSITQQAVGSLNAGWRINSPLRPLITWIRLVKDTIWCIYGSQIVSLTNLIHGLSGEISSRRSGFLRANKIQTVYVRTNEILTMSRFWLSKVVARASIWLQFTSLFPHIVRKDAAKEREGKSAFNRSVST
jgi:hypothetical protein